MSLSAALFNAKSGLNSVQRQVAGASDNIANARTPGYVSKEARVTAQNVAGVGSGVNADIVRSPVDSILLRDVRLEAARLGTLDFRAEATERVALVSGDPSDERSLAFSFTQLETRFQDLFDQPERADLQRQVIFAANDLANKFSDVENAIQGARVEADRVIEDGVRIVNSALEGIEQLNLKVAEGVTGDIDISGVLDERDRLIDSIAEQIGIRTFVRERGEVVITTTEGVTLLDGEPRQLSFSRSSVIDATTTTLSGLEVDGFDIAPTPPVGTQDLRTGIIAGAFIARDQDMVRFQEQIDALAKQTILLFQESDASLTAGFPHTASIFTGFDNDGDGVMDGVDPAATAADVVGLAGALAVNGAVDPDQGGNSDLIRDGILGGGGSPGDKTQIQDWLTALSSTRNFDPAADLTDQTTLQQFASELSTGHLTDRANLKSLADRSRAVFDTLELRRVNENGVNVDEESEKLLELEQAYAANAQVINIIARMFDELLARIA
ncbi:MAG: flagellar hook-associated protein FlgK [Parvularculaceae bacterium]|nr:flagellar hook-associated protein FlgK [Parvularculaceae bacterium]